MRKALQKFDWGVNKISTVIWWISTVAMFFMAFICFSDVIMRYFINSPIRGANEMVELAMPVFVFFGAAMAIRKGQMVRVPLFLEKMKPTLRSIFNAFDSLLCCIAISLFCWQLMLSAQRYIDRRGAQTPTLGVPFWLVYMLASIGCGLMALELFVSMVKEIVNIVSAQSKTIKQDAEVTES